MIPSGGARGPTQPPIISPEPPGTSKDPPRRWPPRLLPIFQQKGALRPPSARSRPRGRSGSRPRGPRLPRHSRNPQARRGKPLSPKGAAARHHCRTDPPAHLNERDPGSH
ncbi:hypothetical protein NDU88_010620 [Pleurodeles waltl]|uniref:Uncharacterized protein n=1 Tax=Pleurodeles waltl TaxID=8319 RepID=A0AAV7S4I6_PLEWA|nr:hypothetical protein NDU88_010620 [Pleurodeles waltl]